MLKILFFKKYHLHFSEKEIFNAVGSGNLDVLKQLLEEREEKNPDVYEDSSVGTNFTVLSLAAYYGHVNITRYFKNDLNFSDINPLDSTNTYTPMMFAAQEGKVAVIQYYLENEKEEIWNRAATLQGIVFDWSRLLLSDVREVRMI